jgi:hypothetical protein
MEISTKQASHFRPTISKIVMAFAFASVMGGMAMTPALGNDNRHDDHHPGHDRHDDHNWHGDHDRHDHHPDYRSTPEYRPVYQHPYVYAQPVYAPPAVYYPPPPSPGVSLFFPLDIRIR